MEILDYSLPEGLIARHPMVPRDHSRLLRYQNGQLSNFLFVDLPTLIPEKALLVFNETKVIRARLLFGKPTGAQIEVFCLEPIQPALHAQSLASRSPVVWKCLIGNLKRWKEGVLSLTLGTGDNRITLHAERKVQSENAFLIRFHWEGPEETTFGDIMEAAGKIPLPPYLHREAREEDVQDYQTVYARWKGSVAAPTAGLHFTDRVLEGLAQKGVKSVFLTLHVGAGTFKPLSPGPVSDHVMHCEQVRISLEAIEEITKALATGRPIIAVGTTSLRTLESLYWCGIQNISRIKEPFSVPQWPWVSSDSPGNTGDVLEGIQKVMEQQGFDFLYGETRLMIIPGYKFRLAEGLITNFHQPGSTLLLLVAAWVGQDWRAIYQHALDQQFRFLSYGDSSLLWRNDRV